MPIARAAIEHLLETDDDFANSAIVKKARAACAPKPEENTGDKAERFLKEKARKRLLTELPKAWDTFQNVWQAFYLRDGREIFWGVYGVNETTLEEQPAPLEEMQKLVDEGLAPTPQQVGIYQPIIFAQMSVLSAHLKELGNKIASFKKRFNH